MFGRIGRRQFIAGAGACLILPLIRRAEAHLAMARGAVALAELRAHSNCCIVGRPVARESHWATVGNTRRVVTVHRLQVDDLLEGVAEGAVLAVRTLGGRVGRIGQRVSGEAAFEPGARAVFFLVEVERDLYAVTDMAGGYYPLEQRDGIARLRATIAAAPGSAAQQLSGASLSSMRQLLFAPAAGALHAP